MKLSRHKFIRRLINYYRTHFNIEVPYVVLIDGTFAFEALQWKIQIDEQLKAYLETDQIVCSTTLCAIKETELIGKIGFGAMLILKQYQIVKCDHYPAIAAEKCFQQVLIKDQEKKYFVASQSLSLREYSHDHRPDLPTMLITHNAINLERPSLKSRAIVEQKRQERINLTKHESTVLKKIKRDLHLDGDENDIKKKKKKKKGINPLSSKKKKKILQDHQLDENDHKIKRKRRRTRQLRMSLHLKQHLKDLQKTFSILFLLGVNTIRVALPVVGLFGTAPTFFGLWIVLRSITALFCSRQTYRRYDDYLYSIYQRFVLFFFQNLASAKVYLHGDYEEIFKKKENALYLSNHQSSVDWVIANILAIQQGSLGHLRYVLKGDLRWIPLYGFYFQQHGCIYVRRNDKGDIDRIQRGMREVVHNGLPIWLVIFPEGTRYNPIHSPEVIERSQRFAEQKGVSPLEHVLYPRSGAVVGAIKALKDKLDAVYDVTVMYNKTYDSDLRIRLAAPSLPEYAAGQSTELHIDVRRIPINDIPSETNDDISDWLYQRFQLKDKIMKRFYDFQQSKISDTTLFSSDNNVNPVEIELPLRETLYSSIFLILATIPFIVTERGRKFYLKICLFGTPLTFFWMHFFPPTRFHSRIPNEIQ